MTTIYDQRNDAGLSLVASVLGEGHSLIPMFSEYTNFQKEARDLPSRAFAWRDRRQFPTHTPEDAVLSWVYAVKQAEHIPEEVLTKIAQAVITYGFDAKQLSDDVLSLESERQAQEKTASANSECFALPEYKRLSMRTPDEVTKSAHALVNQRKKLLPDTVTVAAARLVKKAAEFEMPAGQLPATLYKLAGCTICDAGVLLDQLDARIAAARYVKRDDGVQAYTKIASVIQDNFPHTGVLDDASTLRNIANTLAVADKSFGVDKFHYTKLAAPMEAVFNLEKIAEDGLELNGTNVPFRTLMSMPTEHYEDLFGKDFVEQITDEQGEYDKEAIKSIVPTLPLPMKKALLTHIKAYM